MFDTNYHNTYENPLIDPLNKGLGSMSLPLSAAEVKARNWNLLHEDLSLPTAVLYEERMTHNLNWMQSFVTEYGVKLAPHGKTTMAPKLFAQQLAGGAWGITLATVHQTRVAYFHGVRRIIMANQLIGKHNMEIISDLLTDHSFEFCCLVDSADGVDQLGAFFKAHQQQLHVLLELGVDGGRTGIRNDKQQTEVINAIKRWEGYIVLAGVELYEGVLKEENEIDQLLQRAIVCIQDLAQSGHFTERAAHQPVILTGAGSAWYDVVAREFSKVDIGLPLEVILRPGCYLTHDAGIYRTAQAQIQHRNPIAQKMRGKLLPALQLWAYVQSIPEAEKAIVALGKRDAAFDAGLPLPSVRYRPGDSAPTVTPTHWQVTGMMDQHAYLQIAKGDDIKVGDMIGFDISHPCLTFDKWRQIAVLNAHHQVIDVIQTFF